MASSEQMSSGMDRGMPGKPKLKGNGTAEPGGSKPADQSMNPARQPSPSSFMSNGANEVLTAYRLSQVQRQRAGRA